MKRSNKYILITTFLLLTILFFTFHELITYGVRQGKGQLAVLWNAEPIEEILEKDDFPDSLKRKVRMVSEIKSYAINELGMTGSDNYSTVYDQKGKDILWNVSASEPFRFNPHRWWFPIVGSVSYKGFFDLERAQMEAKRLKDLGYDVRIRSVSAWSTLGWFQDPILSNVLDRTEADLAETIFHELTHTTIFLPDSVEFNENLASFVALQATIEYLTSKYGSDSPILEDYTNNQLDQKSYQKHFLRAKDTLDSLYNSFEEDADTAFMREKKLDLIERVIQNYDTVKFLSDQYENLWKARPLPNNAYFMYFARYHETPAALDSLLKNCNDDISRFLEKLKEMNN